MPACLPDRQGRAGLTYQTEDVFNILHHPSNDNKPEDQEDDKSKRKDVKILVDKRFDFRVEEADQSPNQKEPTRDFKPWSQPKGHPSDRAPFLWSRADL
jgi:hypothetical protein